MAIYDLVEQRLCVRIVFDGVGGAGKTTTLRSLCRHFAAQRATEEVFSPGELGGRTLYFDWLEIMAGGICGLPLMCQVVGVPGQDGLSPRREYLLATADAVVFVCDSDPASTDSASRALARVDRDVPLIVQANHQDRPRALSGGALAAALGLSAKTTVVETIATDGIGVADTFIAAVRAISRRFQAAERAVPVGRALTGPDVLGRLQRAPVDPEFAAEMLLEEASATFLIADRVVSKRTPAPMPAAVAIAPPAFPQPDVEIGFVWPAHTARLALEPVANAVSHGARALALDVNGDCEVVVGELRFRTTRALRFESRDDARQALVRAARERTQLDEWLAAGTVLTLQRAADDALWLWTVTPNAPRLPEVLASVEDRRPLLETYAAAVVDVMRASVRHGFGVDLAPQSFGVVGDSVRYFGDAGAGDVKPAANVVSALDEIVRHGWEIDVFLAAFDRANGPPARS